MVCSILFFPYLKSYVFKTFVVTIEDTFGNFFLYRNKISQKYLNKNVTTEGGEGEDTENAADKK